MQKGADDKVKKFPPIMLKHDISRVLEPEPSIIREAFKVLSGKRG
jgi:hypothetical protein